MNTLKIKSILATLAMVLMSGSAWSEEVIVGTGTSTSSYILLDSNSSYYSTSECIYTSKELMGAGIITSIAYNVSTVNNSNPIPIEVYMRHKKEDSYSSSSDCAPASSLILVHSENISFRKGWNEIKLQTPFAYNGIDNLELIVCKKEENSGNRGNNYFYCSSASNKNLYRGYSSSSYADPNYTGAFTRSSQRPYTKFEISHQTYTQNGIKYYYHTDKAFVYDSESISGNVIIPSSIQPGDGKTYNVVGITACAFKDCAATSIKLPLLCKYLHSNGYVNTIIM